MKTIRSSAARRIAAAFVMLAVSVAAAAAEPLTLEAARKLALANSRTLAKYTLAVERAQLDEKRQRYDSLPSISLSGSAKAGVPTSPGETALDTASVGVSAGVSYAVWDGGTNLTLAAIDRIATASARESARAEYFAVLASLDSAWYDLLEARASLAAADAAIAVSDLSLSIAGVKLETGAVSMTEYLSAEATAEANRTTRSLAARNVAVYGAKVASLLGLSALPEIAGVDFAAYDELLSRIARFDDAAVDSCIAKLGAAALAGNPDLAKAALAREKAGKSVALAAAGFSPTVSASASGSLSFSPAGSGTTPSLSVSLSASVPVEVWKTAAEVESAKIAERQAALDLEETARTSDIDVRTAVYDCVSAARAVISSAKALDYAKKHYENKLELYKLSSASVSDVADAAAQVSSNEKALIAARYDFLSGFSSMRSIAGYESDDAIRNLIP